MVVGQLPWNFKSCFMLIHTVNTGMLWVPKGTLRISDDVVLPSSWGQNKITQKQHNAKQGLVSYLVSFYPPKNPGSESEKQCKLGAVSKLLGG